MAEINGVYEVEIIDMGEQGEGIGRIEGLTVFVSGAVLGDVAQVKITQLKKSFAKGVVVEIVKPSAGRREAECPYAGECGGCALQELTYEQQLAMKKKWIVDRLERIGGLKSPTVRDVIGMAEPKHYRNKAQFPIRAGRLVKNNQGKMRNNQPVSVGFYKVRTHEVVNCQQCLLQAPPAQYIAEAVRQYIKEHTVSVYDDRNHMGLLRHLIVRSSLATGEVMVILVVNGNRLPHQEELIEKLDEAINAIPYEGEEQHWYLESVVMNVNKLKGSEILGKECITLAGKNTIMDKLGDLDFEISPLSFYQVNPSQMKVLYDKVAEYAALTGEETVLDLYCGVGTIGLYIAPKAKRVIGIESVRAAVLDANRNATINGIVNAEYMYGKAEEVLPKKLQGVNAQVIILDPPRSGCEEELLTTAAKVGAEKIIYVSCNPATMARDLRVLVEEGYRLEEVQPVDMFPNTGSVEAVALLSSKN